ncbi:sugar transferase [Salibacter halophilus]|uniref:Sugar transferase n=1 Tax=Salibacter halophilus TaxID=1803916 RepID=A0A6N6M9M2_9FLAO|nr:sugar transferase [Salibacter halophilus]KAB1065705.1 sugar transferase [Salibacter halophilus]
MLKRLFDLVSAGLVLVLLFPVLTVIALAIVLDSKGGIFYRQTRVGKNGKTFRLYKFRTMRPNSDKLQITVGHRDPRVTKIGYLLRKYKLDEFPQLLNILKGEMSVVGPRPEVPKYVELYTPEQREVLSVRPGLTDYASLKFVDESELLAESDNPEQTYREEIMPAKLKLGREYVEKQSFFTDLKIIFQTLYRIIR